MLSPGLQYITSRLIIEASLQIPLAEERKGNQVETDFVAVLSVRLPFALDL